MQLSEQEAVRFLRVWINRRPQVEAARLLGVSPQFLNDVLKRRRTMTARLALRIGLKRKVVYEHTNGGRP